MNFEPAAAWSDLVARSHLLRRLRAFFETRQFIEVETPVLSRDIVVDCHLDPLRTTLFEDARQPEVGPTYWLQTSPEFCLKRLVTSAHKQQVQASTSSSSSQPIALFQVAKAFRGGEQGRLHNPEFTLVEWYRVGDDYQAGIQLLADLAEELLGRGTPQRMTWRSAFQQFAQIDPYSASIEQLAELANKNGLSSDQSRDETERNFYLDFLLVRLVEPQLGRDMPVILYDYPADQAALARVRPPLTAAGATDSSEPALAERFELYFQGTELANGYHELLDPQILRARSEVQNKERAADGRFTLPVENKLLQAMEAGMPPCAGCALGFDRLAMLVLGKSSIAEVMAFPADRA